MLTTKFKFKLPPKDVEQDSISTPGQRITQQVSFQPTNLLIDYLKQKNSYLSAQNEIYNAVSYLPNLNPTQTSMQSSNCILKSPDPPESSQTHSKLSREPMEAPKAMVVTEKDHPNHVVNFENDTEKFDNDMGLPRQSLDQKFELKSPYINRRSSV